MDPQGGMNVCKFNGNPSNCCQDTTNVHIKVALEENSEGSPGSEGSILWASRMSEPQSSISSGPTLPLIKLPMFEAVLNVCYLCRCLRRCCPGVIMTGTGGSLCCQSCCQRSDFLCVDLSSCQTESSRMNSYAAAINAGESENKVYNCGCESSLSWFVLCRRHY